MKKLILLFILAAFCTRAQTYYKLLGSNTSDWYIYDAHIPVIAPPNKYSDFNTATVPIPTFGKYSAYTDTVVQSKNYKKFYHVYTWAGGSNMNLFIGYIREDTVAKKVYFLDKATSSVEDLLYDFSLNVGDSAYYNFPTSFGNFPKAWYKVKSIVNTATKVGIRKKFNLIGKNGGSTSDTLQYIESIGCVIHPIYMYSPGYQMGSLFSSSTCKSPYTIGLACKYSNNIKFYQSCTYILAQQNGCFFKYDSCNYYQNCGGISELSAVRKVSVSPNPAQTELSISINLDSDVKLQIELIDISGRVAKLISEQALPAGEHLINFSVKELEDGFYSVRLRNKGEVVTLPLIIMH